MLPRWRWAVTQPGVAMTWSVGLAKRTASMPGLPDDSDFWDSTARKVYWKMQRKATCWLGIFLIFLHYKFFLGRLVLRN
jgi:hypothetical protein